MDFVELPPVKVEKKVYDYAMVIVCRLSGYTMAIPFQKKGMDAHMEAYLFLTKCVWLMGLPKEILSDKDHLIGSKFFTSLCALSGV